MKFSAILSFFLCLSVVLSLSGCAKADKNYGVESSTKQVESVESTSSDSSKITSLDYKMANFFDITLFDEENYSNEYLGDDFSLKSEFDGFVFLLPTTITEIEKGGWGLLEGSDYDKNSLIYAKETVELEFVNENNSSITALFYNSLNTSVRLSTCPIVKIRVENAYKSNRSDYPQFNFSGITNTSVITDIINILGVPSHFYKKTDFTYYFDFFLTESDRRNKIRIYIDLNDDAITAFEISNYIS